MVVESVLLTFKFFTLYAKNVLLNFLDGRQICFAHLRYNSIAIFVIETIALYFAV